MEITLMASVFALNKTNLLAAVSKDPALSPSQVQFRSVSITSCKSH